MAKPKLDYTNAQHFDCGQTEYDVKEGAKGKAGSERLMWVVNTVANVISSGDIWVWH